MTATVSCSACGGAFTPVSEKRKCSSCLRAYGATWRAKRKAAGLSISGARPTPEYQAAYHADYAKRDDVRARRAELMRGYRNGPLRARHEARRMLNNAVRNGTVERQSCEVCGSPDAHGHHDDYAKPLAVRWLCRTHHDAFHASQGN